MLAFYLTDMVSGGSEAGVTTTQNTANWLGPSLHVCFAFLLLLAWLSRHGP